MALPIWIREGFASQRQRRNYTAALRGYRNEYQRQRVTTTKKVAASGGKLTRKQAEELAQFTSEQKAQARTPDETAQALGWRDARERENYHRGNYDYHEARGYRYWRIDARKAGLSEDEFEVLFNAARHSGWDRMAFGPWAILLETIGIRRKHETAPVGESPKA